MTKKKTYKDWREEVLKIFAEEYYLGESDIDEDKMKYSFKCGDTPREFTDWIETKYDLDNFKRQPWLT